MDPSIVSKGNWKWKGVWELGKSGKVVGVGVVLAVGLTVVMWAVVGMQRSIGSTGSVGESGQCEFPAIFNFGDSNSDTGSASATFGRVPLPDGRTFFGKPAGRFSDGRLIIDFLAQKLGLPYLHAYLDAVGANFQHGANFAVGGSTIRPPKQYNWAFSPLSLNVQLLQFEQFKQRTIEIYEQDKRSDVKSRLPRPVDFSKALYTMDCGQNDLHAELASMTKQQVWASIPDIIHQFVLAIERLHQHGARAFWIHNTGPIGCLPFFILYFKPKPSNADLNGCLKDFNEVAQEFNRQLKDSVSKLRSKLQDAVLIYVDIYSAKYTLISEAKQHGFVSSPGYCCGHFGEYQCGARAIVNGSGIYGISCSNPAEHISWDGIHYTEAANQWIANLILNGSLSDPRIPSSHACQQFAHSR